MGSCVSLTQASPLAAGTTWQADEERLFVVWFGSTTHRQGAENPWSCLLSSAGAAEEGGRHLPEAGGCPSTAKLSSSCFPSALLMLPHLSWLWLCSLALSGEERGRHLEHCRHSISTGISPRKASAPAWGEPRPHPLPAWSLQLLCLAEDELLTGV